METIKLQIENVKNIKNFTLEIPFEKGVYAVTGENGIGKTTVFSVLAQLIYKSAIRKFFKFDGDRSSKITYSLFGRTNTWIKSRKWKRSPGEGDKDILIAGYFEGGILFGSRFDGVHKSQLTKILHNQVSVYDLVDADDFVKENLGFILHNDRQYYASLKRMSDESLNKGWYNFRGTYVFYNIPYFIEIQNGWRAHLFLSSGELLMIGLLHFINNILNEKVNKKASEVSEKEKVLILIDEIELALHPASQARLAEFLQKLSSDHDFVIYFSTHSIPIINYTSPSNIFHLYRNVAGELDYLNPCHPVYTTRSLYTNDGFDYLILVEDELAKFIIEAIIHKHSLTANKLIKVLPCGGWKDVLKLHYEFNSSNIAGSPCHILSILDGDVKDEYESAYLGKNNYTPLKKFFLPIKSVEKILKERLIDSPDALFAKELGDKFFRHRSLDDILRDYKNDSRSRKDSRGNKGLYLVLMRCAEEQGINSEIFKNGLCEFIYDKVDFTSLETHLMRELSG